MQNNSHSIAEPVAQKPYSPDFFESLREGSQQSATVIVPLVLNWIQPKSLVDVGCGDGTWLAVFQAQGVEDILGIDGDYVQPDLLKIPSERFMAWDLSQPIGVDRRFDLAMSLEVAEHLPKDSADGFVASLTHLSDVILFSAAIPHQGGTNHINEQWPDYWIARFQAHGYVAIDALREQIWHHPQVKPWYAQNIMLFVKDELLSVYPNLKAISETYPPPRAIVHPKIYLSKCSDLDVEEEVDTPCLSHKVKILDVTFTPNNLQCGDAVTFYLHYHLTSALADVIFSLSLSNELGNVYLDVNHLVTLPPQQLGVLHTVELHIERLDLVKGTYFVNPGAFSADWEETYDFQWHCYPLVIQSSPTSKGIMHPPLRWSSDSISPISPSP